MYGKELKLDFCSKFNYPEEIQVLLKRIVEVLDRKDVLSIMALGSLPRGELSYRKKNQKLVLFSDIDLTVITKARISKQQRTLLIKSLKDLRRRFQPGNPLFDITVEFFTLQDIKKLPFKVRFYELKESGEALFGQDIRHMIPKFDVSNLNIKDTNNIISRRLLSMLLYFPRELFLDKKTDFTQDVFKYIITRNALDIATVLLFQRGIFFPTYRERVEYIVSKSDNFISDFGSDFPDFLIRCLKVKLDMDFNQPLIALLEDALKYFRLLLIHTLRSNGVDLEMEKGLSTLIKKSKNDIFGEVDITKVKFKFILKSPNLNMLQKRLNALWYSFLGCTIFFLLNMNESAYLFLKADRRGLSVLDDSWWVLMRLGVLSGQEPLPIDFVNRFLVLREKFFLDFYIKFMAPGMAERIKEILNWRYE